MFCGNMRSLSYVRTYEEAHALWQSRPEKVNATWGASERPLERGSAGLRKHHYRIERPMSDKYYDVCLYHTTMARFYKPEGNTRVVEYTGHSSQTSSSFMHNVLGICDFNNMMSTDGREVVVPVVPYKELSTRIVLVGGEVDVAQSTHPQLYRLVPSGEDKQERKAFFASIQTWLDMMELRFENSAFEETLGFAIKLYKKVEVNSAVWPDYVMTRARTIACKSETREAFRRALSQRLAYECLGPTAKRREALPMFPSPDQLPAKGVSAY